MSSRYEPKDHIQRLDIALVLKAFLTNEKSRSSPTRLRCRSTTKRLTLALRGAWLTPQIRFGVFSRILISGKDVVNVVLGLQDELDDSCL